MAELSKEIKQKSFKSEFSKAMINLMYTHNYFNQHQQGFLKECGLTVPQFNILRILRGQYPKSSTVNLLIERMLDKSSNASRIVDKLEDKGLVARTKCASDKRAVDVIITDDGLELLRVVDLEIETWEVEVCKLSTNECEQLNLLLDKLRG